MAGAAVVPRNILYFEVLMYLSLMVDALSMLVRDDTFSDPDITVPMAKLMTAVLILLFVYMIWLAARMRKNWARMVLLASLLLSIVSIASSVSDSGVQFETLIDVVSSLLTAAGLYLSFTGDAVGWFESSHA
jgi:glucan phosphoethanolaminetransferase (alkaline phosphatase superfamily)